jgi:Translation initiation factor 1A / IF-1.
MSGLGRRSHYRKHLTDSVLNDFPEPNPPYERIAKVVGTRGSNQFELVVDPHDDPLDETPQLAILPTKFRKLVWLKRNDYVICAVAQENGHGNRGSSSNSSSEGGIRYMIEHILYKDQVKHLKEKGLWPKHEFFSDEKHDIGRQIDEDLLQSAIQNNHRNQKSTKACTSSGDHNQGIGSEVEIEDEVQREDTYSSNDAEYEIEEEDGIVYNNIDEEYFCNMNRVAKLKVVDSSDESEDSD